MQASGRAQGLAPGGRAVAVIPIVPTAFLWGWGLPGRWPPAGRTHRTRGPVQRTAFLDHLPRNGHPLGATFNPTGPIGTPAFQLNCFGLVFKVLSPAYLSRDPRTGRITLAVSCGSSSLAGTEVSQAGGACKDPSGALGSLFAVKPGRDLNELII